MDSLCLADTVRSILSLLVHRWVPICVVENDTVSSGQIDTDATTPGWWDEAKDLGVEIETINHLLPCFDTNWAIQTNIGVAMQVKESLKDIKHTSHLREDQNFWALHVQGLQQLGQAL